MNSFDLGTGAFKQKPLAMLLFDAEEASDDSEECKGSERLSRPAEQSYPSRLKTALEKHFRVVSIVGNCSELWTELFNEIPNVLIVSSALREFDAVGLIRSLKSSRNSYDIRFFLSCRRVNASIMSVCRAEGIDGCIPLDEDVELSAARVFEQYSSLEKSADERRLELIKKMIESDMYFRDVAVRFEEDSRLREALLLPLGFDPEHKGTKYLELMIGLRVLGCESNMALLYALAGNCFGVSKASVEKAVRYSIERAWSGSTPYMQYRLFGNTVDSEKGKPTNAEFVETLVRHTIDYYKPGF